MKKDWIAAVAAVVLLVLAAAGLWWWVEGRKPVPPAALPPAATAPPPVVALAPSEPAIRYPVEVPVAASAPQALDAALAEVFGRKAVLGLFQLQDFPRRFVATVDNLGRAQAPVRMWPLNPVGSRFGVDRRDGGEQVAASNAARYAPYVQLIESVDLRQVATLYARLYPQLQQAYEELGYPKRYFNDRLVEVIDQLLATPEPEGPLKVHLPAIAVPVKPERPWVLYEFDDPALQSLSAGQRVLLRMGAANEQRVKVRLTEFRHLITRRP